MAHGGNPERSLYLAAYDVRDPRRLARVLAAAKTFAVGGQRSLYECWLSEGERVAFLDTMAARLHRFDRFALVRPVSRGPLVTLGIAVAPDDPPFFYQG